MDGYARRFFGIMSRLFPRPDFSTALTTHVPAGEPARHRIEQVAGGNMVKVIKSQRLGHYVISVRLDETDPEPFMQVEVGSDTMENPHFEDSLCRGCESAIQSRAKLTATQRAEMHTKVRL